MLENSPLSVLLGSIYLQFSYPLHVRTHLKFFIAINSLKQLVFEERSTDQSGSRYVIEKEAYDRGLEEKN